ncbi:MAG: hypothetical protein JWO06_3619, partial [Bacteroidota bacterium]|nr:hypothetical protein [Bacteroidota bacterium]
MEKFMFLYRGGMDPKLSPEAMQAQMQKWFIWHTELAKKGLIVSSEPLEAGGRQISGTKKT